MKIQTFLNWATVHFKFTNQSSRFLYACRYSLSERIQQRNHLAITSQTFLKFEKKTHHEIEAVGQQNLPN